MYLTFSGFSYGDIARKALIALFFIGIILGSGGSQELVYSDDASFLSYAETLADNGLITRRDGSTAYRLGDRISRAEIAKIIVNASGNSSIACTGKTFDDVNASLGDLCGYIEQAAALGFVTHNSSFRPHAPATRAEFIKMVVAAQGITTVACTTNFSDVTDRDGEFCRYISTAYSVGWLSHNPRFRPYDTITRGESFKVVTGAKKLVINATQPTVTQRDYTFMVDFPTAMDTGSVVSGLRVYPEVSRSAEWKSPSQLALTIHDVSVAPREYTVNVASDVRTLTGGTLGTILVRTFKTDGIAQIDFISPEGSVDRLDSEITVRFSKPMIALTTLDTQPACPITITPSVEGKCVWITTSSFQFRPTGGWAMGGSYQVHIPQWLPTIAGDTTIDGRDFTITTPAFRMFPSSEYIDKEEPLLIAFNAPVSLDTFRRHFSLASWNMDNLDIGYLTASGSETAKNIIRIFPKTGDWLYGSSYRYTIREGMVSDGGNVGLDTTTATLSVRSLIENIRAFVYRDSTLSHPDLPENMRFATSHTIIPPDGLHILYSFHEDIPLDASLFSLSDGSDTIISRDMFAIRYGEKTDCSDGTCRVVADHKAIILDIDRTRLTSPTIGIEIRSIPGSAREFRTTTPNTVVGFKNVDYRNSCVVFARDVAEETRYFDFGTGGEVSYLYKVAAWSDSSDTPCTYKAGVSTYVLSTVLTPDSPIRLTISGALLDTDNVPLDRAYSYTFTTPKALPTDQHFRVVSSSSRGGNDTILVPVDLHPLGMAVATANMDTLTVKVCQSEFDITATDFLGDPDCQTSDVSVHNLGFHENLTVLDIENLFGKAFTRPFVSVSVSNPDDPSDNVTTTRFFRSNTSVVLRTASNQTLLWIEDFRTGEILDNAISTVKAYRSTPHYNLFGRYTGQDWELSSGTISFDRGDARGTYRLSGDTADMLVITRKSGEVIPLPTSMGTPTETMDTAYLHLDRALYRAGDTVHIKGTLRSLAPDGYHPTSLTSVRIGITDPASTSVFSDSIDVSSRGSFEATFSIPSGSALGEYRVTITADADGLMIDGRSETFLVAQYEKPNFEVKTHTDKTEYLYGDTAHLSVTADSMIGTALVAGQGTYSVTAREYSFDGGKATKYTWGEHRSWWEDFRYGSSYLPVSLYGDFTLDRSGTNSVSLLLANTSGTGVRDAEYTVSTTVTDPRTHKSIASDTTFRVLRSTTFVGMKTDKYSYDPLDTARLDFATVDIEGNPVATRPIAFRIYRIIYSQDPETLIYGKQESLVASGALTTDTHGLANTSYRIADAGEYRFEVSLADGRYTTSRTLYVWNSGLLLPKDREHALPIASSKDSYEVGDEAEFVIESPYDDAHALITVEKLGGILRYEVIDITDFSQPYTLSIRPEYLPGFTLHAYLIHDTKQADTVLTELSILRDRMHVLENSIRVNQGSVCYILFDFAYDYPRCPSLSYTDTVSGATIAELANARTQEMSLLSRILPDYRDGTKDVTVTTKSVTLDARAQTDRSVYLPHDTTTVRLTITNPDGTPANGEATVVIIDRSLLTLKSHTKPIIETLYAPRLSYIPAISTLEYLVNRFEFTASVSGSRGGGDGYRSDEALSIGNVTAADMASPAMPMAMEKSTDGMTDDHTTPESARTDFRDVAYYSGTVVVTDGHAMLTVDHLPDDLTTWNISGYVITPDTKAGEFSTDFIVRKPISLLPSIPRFFIASDETSLTAVIANTTDTDLDTAVTLTLTGGVRILGDALQDIMVPAHSEARLSWWLAVDPMTDTTDWSQTTTTITLSAVSGDFHDALTVSRPIHPYATPEYVFTNGSTQDTSYEEKIILPDTIDKTQGKLDIALSPTVLGHLMDSTSHFADMPSWNAYSLISALAEASTLRTLYTTIDDISAFDAIRIRTYDGDRIAIDTMVRLSLDALPRFVQSDGGLAYTSDTCWRSYTGQSCSDFWVTGYWLSTVSLLQDSGYSVDATLLANAKTYYHTQLQSRIDDTKTKNRVFSDIDAFLPLLGFDDEKSFILTNLPTPTTPIDTAKAYTIRQRLDVSGSKTMELAKAIRNGVFVEARGTFFPAYSDSYGDSVAATAYALRGLIADSTTEKFLTENMVRWLLAQKNVNGSFGSYGDTILVYRALSDFARATGELTNVGFTAHTYINNEEVLAAEFSRDNRFSTVSRSFPLAQYLQFGENSPNGLGFTRTGTGRLYYDIGMRYFLPVDAIDARDEGIVIDRAYYDYDAYIRATATGCVFDFHRYFGYEDIPCLMPLTELVEVTGGNAGDRLVGRVQIVLSETRHNVIVHDFIPAGAEIVDSAFDTTSQAVRDITGDTASSVTPLSRSKMSMPMETIGYPSFSRTTFDHVETRDNELVLYAKDIDAGVYTYTYVLQLDHAGTYHHPSATAEEMEHPEVWGRTAGGYFTIRE